MSQSEIELGISCTGRSVPQGYALWEYTGETWSLRKDVSEPGAVPSGPPTIAGMFRGQLRATPSVCASSSSRQESI